MRPLEKIKWMAGIASDHSLTGSAVRIGNILADCLNGQTGLCNPDQLYLAEITGLSRRGVQEAIKSLAISGWIERTEGGKGKGNRTKYRLLKGAKNDTIKGADNAHKEKVKGAKNSTQKAQKTTAKGAKNDIPLTIPYKEEPVKESVKGIGEVCSAVEKRQPQPPAKKIAKKPAPTAETWQAYSEAYRFRYGVEPVRNATVNGQLSNFVKRLGAGESPQVAAYYLSSNNAFYVRSGHTVGLLVKDAEKLRTEWITGKQTTQAKATQLDRSQSNYDAAQEAIAILSNRRKL